LCYGYFLKQLKQSHAIRAAKHPSIIKKVSYKDLVEELWKTPISDDPEEGSVLKKTIANCNYGMLKKQINRTQKSKIFDTYEDAEFVQLKYGGNITFIKQYEERSEWKTESPLDQGVEDAPMIYTNEMVATGRSLFILNLSAEASVTNGFRYFLFCALTNHGTMLPWLEKRSRPQPHTGRSPKEPSPWTALSVRLARHIRVLVPAPLVLPCNGGLGPKR